jgi:alkanesulfonate monooxygenase SsuD/methylene tetrahydromethanopterin reductase-like flavin-dependent oxidoreductase (luciferase family)
MQIDLGLDPSRLPYEEQRGLHEAAARLGYERIWTTGGQDPFQVCVLRWQDSLAVRSGGIGTAIGVAPVPARSPYAFAASTAAAAAQTGGRFVLGIGSGSIYSAAYRRTWGIRERSPLALVRAYLTTVRAFLAGEAVDFECADFSYRGARLGGEAPPAPIYLGALGAEMARLGGELSDGLVLSWCTAAQVDWIRDRIREGAAHAGRDAATVKIATNVRVCVDNDAAVARQALARAIIGYVLATGGASTPLVYRPHLERMGFAPELATIDAMVEKGADREQIIADFPERLLQELGYYGSASGAAAAVKRIAGNADAAIVRVVPVRADAQAALDVMQACEPSKIS